MVTQKQIARHLGVSQSAVACAFHPTLNRNVSLPKRNRIISAARELGYEPHHAARRLVRRRFKRTTQPLDQAGLIFFGTRGQTLDSVCPSIIIGAEQELSKHNASFVFVNAGLPGGWEKVERIGRASSVDGWLVYGKVTDLIADRLAASGLPFVVVGDHVTTRAVNCVRPDNHAVGRLAAEHFFRTGHRHVAYLAGDVEEFRYSQEMLAGFRAARREFGLVEDEQLVARVSEWHSHRFVGWLAARDAKPTGFFASENGFAEGVRELVTEHHIPLRDASSILGCELTNPNFKSPHPQIELPITEVGRQAVAVLHQVLLDPIQPAREICIPPRYVPGTIAVPAPVASAAVENFRSTQIEGTSLS